MDKQDVYLMRRMTSLERRLEFLEAKVSALEANPINTGDFYTVPQFAKAMNCCELTIRRQIRSGILKGVKVGKYWRIPKSELKETMMNE